MHRLLLCLALLGTAGPASAGPAACNHDTGISVPAGFCATVFADHLGPARHIAVGPDGTVYVALQEVEHGGGIAVLRDTAGAGHADEIHYFGGQGGSGIGLHDGHLYFATPTAVLRYALKDGLPAGEPETVVGGFPEQDQHAAKTIAFDGAGHLYVNVGAPSNACQQQDRAAGSPGESPCPLLAEHAGIWRFAADKTGQHFPADGLHFATGIRNAVAVTWADGNFYAVQMGRDQLSDNWPKLFSDAESAELPAEEFLEVHQGDNFGWPYCYFDGQQHKKVLAPEYGGDGKKQGVCAHYGQPIASYPGHWAPEAVLFYRGDRFPAAFRGGAFISFHGSWNRAPLPQAGFKVVFQPFAQDKPAGSYVIFADGFAASTHIVSEDTARYRPMGLAEGPDGALYIGDTQEGRVWKVIYTGQK